MEIATEFFSASTFATLAVGLVAGLLRGFTGFGGAIFAIPLLSLIYGPTTAIAVVLASGIIGTVQLLPGALVHANWRQVVPLIFMALLVTPLGTYLLLSTDPDMARRGIGVFVLIAAFTMLRGWTWQGPRNTLVSGIAGAACGLVTGLGGVGGSVATLYLISSKQPVAVIRANLVVIIGALTVAGFSYLAAGGGVTADDLFKVLIYLPVYMVFIWIGSRIFRGSSDRLYRRVALWLLIVVGMAATVW